MPTAPTDPAPLHPERLTWAALLGRWVEFARSAIALPDDETGVKLRQAVPDLIMLQAVAFALENLGELESSERALGIDRAEVLIEKHVASLEELWPSEKPAALCELVDDAREALRRALLGPPTTGRESSTDPGT